MGSLYPSRLSLLIIVLLSLSTSVAVSAILYLRRKSRRKTLSTFPYADQHTRVSYGELLKATNGFSSENLVGVGSFGSVYKGVLCQDQTVVAVKVLNLQQQGASKSFMSECEALGKIRHRNLLQIITACSSVDFQGNDFKALVLEFMPNGNLESWLYPSKEGQNKLRVLSLIQRLNVAIDVAFALDYLHHQCETTIVHCDVKPSNILLDKDMTAHLGDFGLAKILSISSIISGQSLTNSIALRGSIGYIAPEYGTSSEVSAPGDMYSYGILLLEMFIGTKPTHEMFSDGLSLHRYVQLALTQDGMKLVDPGLLYEDEHKHEEDINAENQNTRKHQMLDGLVKILKIGIACSLESPRERMDIKDVVVNLCTIRAAFEGFGIQGERQNMDQIAY